MRAVAAASSDAENRVGDDGTEHRSVAHDVQPPQLTNGRMERPPALLESTAMTSSDGFAPWGWTRLITSEISQPTFHWALATDGLAPGACHTPPARELLGEKPPAARGPQVPILDSTNRLVKKMKEGGKHKPASRRPEEEAKPQLAPSYSYFPTIPSAMYLEQYLNAGCDE